MKTYAVGDIHGCLDELKELVGKIQNRDPEPKKFVFLGDYIDRGPDSEGVIDFLRDLSDKEECVFLMGNHEDMAINATIMGGEQYYMWVYNGGGKTLESFENDHIPGTYMEWLRNLKLYHEDDEYIYVHAGLMPGYAFVEQKNARQTLLWIRQDFLGSNFSWGKRVVHGHTPTPNVEIKPNRINIDTGAVFGGRLTSAILEPGQEPLFIYVNAKDYYHG